MVGSLAGVVLLALFIWALCYCIRLSPDRLPVKERPRSFIQAFPIASPTFIANSGAPTIIDGPSAELGAITYATGPSLYGSQNNVRSPTAGVLGVSSAPPKISIRRPRPGGGSSRRRGNAGTMRSSRGDGNGVPSIVPLAPNPTNGILVNRKSGELRTEGLLLGQLIDAEFYPDVDV